MNTEEMQRAANTFDNAVDQLQRVASQFENMAYQMPQAAESMAQSVALMDELLGDEIQGKAVIVNRLARALEAQNNIEKFKCEQGQVVINKPEVHSAIEALKLYEQAFEAMLVQCCSNGIKDAWGKPVDCTLLNQAHCAAGKALKGK